MQLPNERILCILGLSLGSCDVRAIVLLKNCDCDRHYFFEAPSLGYAVLWSVDVGAAGAPVDIRRCSQFIASLDVVDKAQLADGLPGGCWLSVNMRRQVGSTPHVQFNPIQKKHFWTYWSIGFNRISLAPKWKLFLCCSFFTNQIQIKFNPIQEVELDSFFFLPKNGL